MNISSILGVAARRIAKGFGFGRVDLCSNTGLKSRECDPQTVCPPSLPPLPIQQELASGVDWLMGTIHDGFRDLEEVREFALYVADAIGDTLIQLPHGIGCGIQWHPYLWRGVLHNSQVSCFVDDNLRTHVWVSITGKSCRLDQQRLIRLMLDLALKGFCCTRIDCATSDPKNRLKCKQITNAINKRDCSGFHPDKSLSIQLPHEKDWTRYCGVKNGGKSYTRIYQRPDQPVRIERQFVKRDARLVFADLVHFYDNRDTSIPLIETEYFRRICSYSISGISFLHRISKNLSRCPELRWWAAFKKACATEAIRFPPITKDESLEIKKRWVERSVATTLALLKKWLGKNYSDWLYRIVAEGAERLTDKQLAMLQHSRSSLKRISLKQINFRKKIQFTGNLKAELKAFAASLQLRDDEIFAGLREF